MKRLCTIQHTEAEYFGLMEDHLDGRNIRYAYFRPFTAGGMLPTTSIGFDGLVLLGAGPYGIVSGHILPSLAHELRLTRTYLAEGKPVLGIGLGAVILAVASGGGARDAPLRFGVETVTRTDAAALGGHLPQTMPMTYYLRDMPVMPKGAQVLAQGPDDTPRIFTVGTNSLGIVGHPGMKRGMCEDLIMEFEDTPEDTVGGLEALGASQVGIAEALTDLMVGIVARAGWM